MKGSETKLVSYMQGSDKRFVIPVYQRNYDWKTENCKQLYDDLIKVIRRGRKSHFFGSIVSVHNDGEFNEYLVIDGQQRLTTISLLLLAMYNLMKNGVLTPEKGNLAEKIYKTYLIDEWQDDDTRIKLKPVKDDRKAFGKLFEEDSEHIPDSNLTINYNYFFSRIQKEEITIDALYEAVTKLEIINITLNQDDNPQLIFESLNSTGVALSEGDKIRNFILMGLPAKQQNDFYEKYWNKIEVCTGYDVSTFVRDYLSVKQQRIPAMSKVYTTFKTYIEEKGTETEPLLEELLSYAKRYEMLLKGNTSDKELNACIDRLNRLETTVTRPFFLEVLRLRTAGKLALADAKEIFLYTENYLFRRTICDLPTNALNKIFLMLHREIIRYDGTDNCYLEKFKYALNSKSDRGRFPDDEEFVEAFAVRPVYQMNSKNKIYILERFENYGTVEVQNVYQQFDEGVYSIEHIMPQHLTPAWIKELGEDYEAIHEMWLHRMANLTLTGYNSKYSNSPFLEKRDMKNGFIDSHLYMNNWIGQQGHWGLAELEARNQMMMQRALTIWPRPTSDFKPMEKQMDSYSLGDDVELSGREIVRFGFKNTEQPVTSWIDMMEQVLKMFHAEDKSVLSRLAYSKGSANDLEAYVSNKPQDLRSALEIDTDIYIERNTSTSTKISMLHKFFKAYDADEEDLVFYLKDMNDDGTAQEAGTRYERYRRYWAFALPYIRQAYDDGTGRGCFSGCTTSKGNWLNGSFGIGGFGLACIANHNKARVDLTLAHSKKERNKEAFDYLYGHKEEIEAALGTQLSWQRSENTKGSYIVIHLEGVSIDNEADWTQMAKFHAEWSKKFYDVFVPYLKQKY
ncbi:MAG: DUF4268 domain-containing protein [Faecalibacterium sp.]